jgi:signal peptidase I
MSPTLRHGDRVIVDLWTFRRRPPRPGEVVLFEGPRGVAMVKRVAPGGPTGAPTSPLADAAGPGEELFWVLGDNQSNSVDSREFGPVARHRFRGRLLWRYWPWSRAGAIR